MNINADRIRILAAQKGMNLTRLADKAGISRQTLSTTMTRGTCRAETIVKICEALEVEPIEIMVSRSKEAAQ